jgi:hypothetical protein
MHACNRNINAINYAPYHQESTSLKKTYAERRRKQMPMFANSARSQDGICDTHLDGRVPHKVP